MASSLPCAIWPPTEFHRRLMSALDEAYDAVRKEIEGFDAGWRSCMTIPKTKTTIRQSPMLGAGGARRDLSGFRKFAKLYAKEEGKDRADRYGFERYQDFAFYTAGDWYEGMKRPLMVAEVESNSGELLGELSGLISIRCPHKYLFIAGYDTLNRLTQFCCQPGSPAVDWAGTTYHVIEIPNDPSPPSQWTAFRASIMNDGDELAFVRAV